MTRIERCLVILTIAVVSACAGGESAEPTGGSASPGATAVSANSQSAPLSSPTTLAGGAAVSATTPTTNTSSTTQTAPPTTATTSSATPINVKPKSIMFIGDSVTRGSDEFDNASRTFRGTVFRLLTGSGVPVDFVGSQTLTPTVGGDPNHEGYNGASIQDTFDRISTMLPADMNPDVIVLELGYNDVFGPRAGIVSRYEALIRALRATKPNSVLILCTLHPERGETEAQYRVRLPAWADLMDTIRALANASDIDDIYLADVAATPFFFNDYFDGVHLSQSGADKFGAVVYRTLLSAFARSRLLQADAQPRQ